MSDKKIFENFKKGSLNFKPKSKEFTSKLDRAERQEYLKVLISKKSRRLNNRERQDLINLLSKKDNLTFKTLYNIIEMKDDIKLKQVEINNANRELEDLESQMLKKRILIDENHFVIEKHSLRLNKILTKY